MDTLRENPVTVAELQEWLKQFPVNRVVRGYEGEGGAWIVVDDNPASAIQTPEEGPLTGKKETP